LLCARVDIGVTESPTTIILKIANKKKKKTQFGSDIFYIAIIIKVGVRIPFSVGNFHLFGRGKTNF